MLSYQEWTIQHSVKHKNIINKLNGLNDDDIISYFDFDNMVIQEPDFCLLYSTNTKCHDIDTLNCYLCACPYFRLTNTKSSCSINAKDSDTIKDKDGFIHQDCSKCTIPHHTPYIKKHFHKDWSYIMKDSYFLNS
jgi:Zn-finger protein